MAGVSSRTRSKNVPLFGSLLLGGSSKRRKSDEEDKGLDYVSRSKKRKMNEEPFVVPADAEVVSIDDDEYEDVGQEGSEHSDDKMSKDGKFVDENCEREQDNPVSISSDEYGESDEEHFVDSDADNEEEEEEEEKKEDDAVKEGVKSDESGGIGRFSDKGEKVIIDLDDSEESEEEDDSDESEENDSSDEDFAEEEEVVEKEKKEGYRKDFNVVEELVRKVKSQKRGISEGNDEEVNVENCSSSDNDDEEMVREGKDKKSGISERNNEKVNVENSPSYDNDEEMVREVKRKKSGIFKRKYEKVENENVPSSTNIDELEHADHASVSSCIIEKKGSSSSKLNGVSETLKPMSVDVGVNAKSKAKSKENVGDSDRGKDQFVKGLDVGGVSSVHRKQEKMNESDKQKTMENKRRDYKGRANICNGEKKESIDTNGLNQSVKSTHFTRKELRSLELLVKCYWERKNTINNDSIVLEDNDDGVGQQDTWPPPVSVETPRERIWSLKKVEKVEKTKEEEEEEVLWDEFDTARRESDAESMIGNLGENGGPSFRCEHDSFLDEEIGLFCKLCHEVVTEIKYISPPVIDRFPGEGSGKKASFDGVNVSHVDGSQLNVSDNDSETNFSRNEGTVWDLIPGVKQKLYPHQQEGFEFIWKNMAGHTELQKLKNADPSSEGGCIISHAPGTGKTRLTIVFLKAYLKAFPKCLPIIVAPASILLTWEDEFKKLDIGVPFHNLNNPELSGKEHPDAVETFDMSNARHNIHETRMAKLISWFKEPSILGISYNLFGKKCQDKRKHENVNEREGNCDMRKVLLNSPGLLVLDEGHTPRNQRSHIWKVFLKLQTQKRIILSGTPFQNNFWELYSTLSLVKPSFPNTIPPELKSFCQNQGLKSSKKWNWEPALLNKTRDPSDDQIKKFKLLMDPFVHVHKGAILENKLPGLRDSLVTLKAGSLQNEILKSIKRSQNTIFNFERKVALTSVHPSLFLECALSEEEKSALDKDQLEKLRLNPHEGVKTKFLFEFVRLCDAFHEKVLVFSQFHAPLQLIKDQLNSAFKWSEGKEVLVMSGEDPPKVKQSVIHSFNVENCQAKVLLASTKACSEGISLVGASRVVLLDVVWNPSVERQAISRAYRIGQKRVVYTYHLLAEGTTEEEKYGKQAEKDRLSELVFSAKNAANNGDKSKSSAVNFEDRVLDEMTKHEKLKGIFVKCVVLRKERDVV
ncbi:SNF2 domain-containing protein CLASSY 3 [Medicago truncatula]|uniref:SNF2 domain-containing protein CLASSY 3 n=1 Tax=Medicago truncatula TaxID=3880 RepID=UPI001967BA76|nr:SNF2 domain-containing protein CLASSY 3 [Medicago truncatula]